MYKTPEAMTGTQNNVAAIAQQTLITERYLSPYHKHLTQQFVQGEIDQRTYLEETSAIATAMSLINRKHLAQVEAAQHARLRQIDPKAKPVNLVSRRINDHGIQLSGTDATLMTLIGLNTLDDLEEHTRIIKQSTVVNGKPTPIFTSLKNTA